MIYRIEIHGEMVPVPASVWFAYQYERHSAASAREVRNVAIAGALLGFVAACFLAWTSRTYLDAWKETSAERDALQVQLWEARSHDPE